MKKIFVIALTSTLLFACGGGPTSPCDCAEALGEMTTSFEEARGDDAKEEELNKKFEQLDKDCEALRDKMGKEKYMEEFMQCMEDMEK